MTITPPFLSAFPLVAAQAPAVTVLLIAAPAGLQGKVQGEVVNTDKSGQIIIATPKGEVIIRTDAPLQVGQTVELKLPQNTGGTTPHNAVLQTVPGGVSQPTQETSAPLPPALFLDIAEDAQTGGHAPRGLANVLPGYSASQSLSPGQTLLQLIGQSLPATVLPQTPEEAAMGAGGVAGTKPLPMTGLDKVQILFIGNLEEAQSALNTTLSNALSGKAPLAGTQAPVLAQFMGLTPQKLPIFETLALPSELRATLAGLPSDGARPTLPKLAHIVLHTSILMTPSEAAQQKPIIAMIANLPSTPPSLEAMFAIDGLETHAPLLAQLLRDPGAMMPPAMAAQMQALIPRAGTPRFAMNVAFAMLGLTSAEPAEAMFGAKMLQALKAEQRAQLQKEMQALPSVLREGAQQNVEGLRFNLPVEMAGQMYLWQMTLRGSDQDRQGQSGAGRGDLPTRFILDLYMSRLGPMQVDGLSFPTSKRLELILRSKEPFQKDVQEMIRGDALAVFERANLVGNIDFQTY